MCTNTIGMRKEQLDTPALCLDTGAVECNLKRMADFFAPLEADLRPHFKTHKTPILAHMQLEAGAIGITCAKLGEAEVLAQSGVRDILIANQVVTPAKIRRLVNLAGYTDVMVAVDTAENARDIHRAARGREVRVRVLIEVDVGMKRCGVPPDRSVTELARAVLACDSLQLEGVMGYEGHAVMLPDPEKRRAAAGRAMGLLVHAAELLEQAGVPVKIVSGGGTGTCATTARCPGVTEVQAGSYLTMDRQYRENVGIRDFDYALTLLATVVHADARLAVGDAGMKSLSTDFGMPGVLHPPGWTVRNLAEEHCFLENTGGDRLKPGDMVELVPSHGCTTINLHDVYHVLRDGLLDGIWPIAARGRSR
ncbi:MAG: DSD1 family PLP-dependent enzyme [Spirochaetota bacterium]